MFISEEKLPVQIAKVDCVKVNDVNLLEARKEEVLQKFATDAASAHKQHARLEDKHISSISRKYRESMSKLWIPRSYLSNALV